MESPVKFGHKLRMLREIHNYTQDYVADYLHIATSTYSLLEKGQSTLTVDRLEKLAGLYKMDLSDLIRISDQTIIHQITHSNGILSETVNISQTKSDLEIAFYNSIITQLQEQNKLLVDILNKISSKYQ